MLAACDCPAWTADDARLWWQTYGEAACNISRLDSSHDTANASGVETMFDASRM